MIGRLARLGLADLGVEEETVRALASVALPLVQQCDGFVAGYFMQDMAGAATLVTLWRDADAHDRALPQMERAMAALEAAGAEVIRPIEHYASVLYADSRGIRRLDG